MPTKDEKQPSISEVVYKLVKGAMEVNNEGVGAALQLVNALNDRINALTDRIKRDEDALDELAAIVAGLTAEVYVEDDMSESLILNITQTAKVLGISRATVYKLIESGTLPARKFASSEDAAPRMVVLSEDLKTFLSNLPSVEGQPAS